MEQVDYEMLKEDINFPLSWDCDEYKLYLFDSDNNMVAMVYSDLPPEKRKDHPFERLIGGCKTTGEKAYNLNPKYMLHQGDFYDVFEDAGEPFGCVRGWGRLQYKNNPEQRQDNIAAYILNVMNNFDVREQFIVEMMQQDEKGGLYEDS